MPDVVGSRHRTKNQRARDLVIIAEMYLGGALQTEIAQKLGITQARVSQELRVIQKEWEKRYAGTIHELKMRELAKIDSLELMYLEQFQKSMKMARVTREEKQGTKESYVKERTEESQLGDPRYLQGIQWCIEQRCKLLGLNAPVKVAPTDPTGEREYGDFTDKELARRLLAVITVGKAADSGGDA